MRVNAMRLCRNGPARVVRHGLLNDRARDSSAAAQDGRERADLPVQAFAPGPEEAGLRHAGCRRRPAAMTGTVTARGNAPQIRMARICGTSFSLVCQASCMTKCVSRLVSLALGMTGRRNTVSNSPLS